MNTFIKMLASVTDPVTIERYYQIFAAKRELLTPPKPAFKHSVMEPRPVFDTKCPDKVDLHHVTRKAPEGYKTGCVDHCHATDIVRGILCHPCNKALGAFKDRPDVLLDVIKYLERIK